MARSCARQVLGVFRDLVARGIDTTRPLYIVELGAGCGRFAYHFLTNLLELHAPSALADVRFCYVMTDHAEKTLEFWRRHEQLAQLPQRFRKTRRFAGAVGSFSHYISFGIIFDGRHSLRR